MLEIGIQDMRIDLRLVTMALLASVLCWLCVVHPPFVGVDWPTRNQLPQTVSAPVAPASAGDWMVPAR